MIGQFDFTGAGREINASGAVFRYERGTSQGASTGLRVRADGQDLGTFEPGDMVRLPAPAARWELIPVSAALVGFVRIGPASFETSRVTGQVAIAPSTYSQAMQHRAFVRNFTAASAAGQMLEYQLWVPSTSQRVLAITQVENSTNSPSNPVVAYIDSNQAPDPFGWAWSKRGGLRHDLAGASFTTRGYATPRSSITFPTNNLVYLARNAGYSFFSRVFSEPIIVMPGTGITFYLANGAQAGHDWMTQCEFLEIPLSEL